MPIHFDAYVGALGLPVELGVCDIEEVSCSHNLFGGYAHEADFGGITADFGCPEAEELLICLYRVPLRKGG